MTSKSGNTWQVATWAYNPDGQTQTDPPSGSKTVYFTNTQGWSNIKAHAWDSSQTPLLGNWPGTSVTWDSKNSMNQDIYKITVPANATGIVFSNNGGAQTVDLVPVDNTGYYPQSQNNQGKWNCGSWSPVKQIATTAQPTTVAPTTVQPTTVQPTTVQPTTVQPTTVQPTTVQPTTVQPTTVQPTTVPENTNKVYLALEPETYEVTINCFADGYPTFYDSWDGSSESIFLEDEDYYGKKIFSVYLPKGYTDLYVFWYGETIDGYMSDELNVENNVRYFPVNTNVLGRVVFEEWEAGTALWTEIEPDPVTTNTLYIAFDSEVVSNHVYSYGTSHYGYPNLGFTNLTLEETGYYGKNIYKLEYPSYVASLLIDYGNGGTVYFAPENNARYYTTTRATPEGDSRNMWYVEKWEAGTAPWAVYNPNVPVEPATEVKPTDVSVTGPQDSIYYAGNTFKPSSYSLSLKDNIAINFRVKPEAVEGYTNLCLMVSYNDSKEIIIDYTTLSDGTLVFQFDKILPQSVGEAATAVLYGTKDGKNYYGDQYSKSVLDYADKYQVSGSSSLKGLLVNLLRYCAEVQKYTGNDVDNLVSDHIVPEAARYAKNTLVPMDDVKNYHAEACPNTATSEFKKATLVLGSSVGIKVTFTADELSGKSIRVDYNGNSTYFNANKLTDEGNGRASFIYDLYANQMHDTVRFTVCEGTTPISDTMTYSAASYAGKFIDNESVGPLLTQLMLYGQAAEYYSTNP
ncbi:MAG: starch-binding protein [Ruminococcus sp.]|nr:starch-binding protein [Ruminococcus sp.]